MPHRTEHNPTAQNRWWYRSLHRNAVYSVASSSTTEGALYSTDCLCIHSQQVTFYSGYPTVKPWLKSPPVKHTTLSAKITEMAIILYFKGISHLFKIAVLSTKMTKYSKIYCPKPYHKKSCSHKHCFYSILCECTREWKNNGKQETQKYLKTILSGKVQKCPTSVHGLTHRNRLWLHGPHSNCDVSWQFTHTRLESSHTVSNHGLRSHFQSAPWPYSLGMVTVWPLRSKKDHKVNFMNTAILQTEQNTKQGKQKAAAHSQCVINFISQTISNAAINHQ